MKTYIKPLMRAYCIVSSFTVLAGSGPDSSLKNAEGIVHNEYEPELKQLTKGNAFVEFIPSGDEPAVKSPWDE